ncbi:hypothetical protein HPT25_02380 [Bacillus sp. BRMEA1]|uniref:hypothetical protein n=1 Tax=Neobacillus endophyticus TaxID=2738405 RepID=UPI0015632822|nr:hypothetical protein [Neobacillus endophyticus]NRD76333.1 hypothetical protein [Neobacillus endophyticus]
MKIALICPANTLFMPYVENYKKILDENKMDYAIMNWDRFHLESVQSGFTYRDMKKGHQRSLYDYYKYKTFVIKKLKENRFNKVIVFGLQLAFFLRKYLNRHFKGNYAIDIRDHNRIIDIFSLKNVLAGSALTVISSPGYKHFLPESEDYVINHNTQIDSLKELKKTDVNLNKEKLKISCIGAIRDYDVNISFINALKENNKFELFYHGEGNISDRLKAYIQKEKVSNTFLTGRYEKGQEEDLYSNSDMINVFLDTNGIHNKTLLPNRLYQSAKHRKPVISFAGSSLADEIKEYNLGLVIESLDRFEVCLKEYISNFNKEEYENGINSFFTKVIDENKYFKSRLEQFCQDG